MDAFSFSPRDISSIVRGVITDELSRADKSNRTRINDGDWSDDLVLGSSGLDLDPVLIAACQAAVVEFFNLPKDCAGAILSDDTLGVWAQLIDRALKTKMTQFTFRPAGRGSELVSFSHRADTLFQDAAAAASLLQGRRRMVSFVSPHSLVGFAITVLVPKLQGIDVIDARELLPDEITQKLAFGDVIVATPSVWSYMVREGVTAPDNTMGVTFGEVMSRELGAQMRRKGIGVLREFYGSTQTGILGWRDSSTDRFALFDHFERDGQNLNRHLPGGRKALIDAMDFLQWENDRGFTLAGRRDGAIQIGAINVFPDWIANVIEDHARVAKCEIVVSETATGANRLVANIYLKSRARPTENIARDIDTHARSRLAIQERPQIYNFFDI